jgi:hypothetical protein
MIGWTAWQQNSMHASHYRLALGAERTLFTPNCRGPAISALEFRKQDVPLAKAVSQPG